MPEARRIEAVAVVVPVHDEEDLLGGCLRSVTAAASALLARPAAPRVVVMVVLDRCTDRSAVIAAEHGVETVVVDAGSVGRARRAGVAAAARVLPHSFPSALWLAHTDADTLVPVDWLVHQVACAEEGADLVIGRVRPDPADLGADVLRRWAEQHSATEVAAHVHGANLGVRHDAYLRVGGFPPVRQHEDVRMVAALLEQGSVPRPGLEVVTSGRTVGRVPGGFSGYLGRLVAEGCQPPTYDWSVSSSLMGTSPGSTA